MAERLQCEFSLIRYVPDVVKGEFANIGVVLRQAGSAEPVVRFTRDWARVRCMDADADTGMLEALESEIAERARFAAEGAANVVESSSMESLSTESSSTAGVKTMWELLEDSLSNSVQLTAMRGVLAESVPAEMEALMRMYVEPMKGLARAKKLSGRAAVAGEMRTAFERAGVWKLMRKRIRAAEYTQAGDPLKIDCGYRNGPQLPAQVRLFQAVSLESDAEMAKGMAYSAAGLRAGVLRVEGVELELTAIVEPFATVSDEEQYRFGMGVMESEGLRVLTTADLGRVAETARRELRV